MPVFADKKGREWKVEIDFGVVLDWKADCALDLLGDADESASRLLNVLVLEPFKLADLLWVACREKAGGMTREEFTRLLPGDTDKLRDLLAEGYVLFSHGRKRGAALLPTLLDLLAGTESTSNESASSLAESSELTPAL